jgi:NAD dependent epimerase/dehydratase family enzyme
MPWISLEDEVRAIEFLLQRPVSGPVNLAAGAVRNADFARSLGRALRRPALLPLPERAMRLAFGQRGEELLLFSQRVVPRALLDTGFTFRHADLGAALRTAVRGNRDAGPAPGG